MSRAQIEKDFKELCPGGNAGVKIQEYYRSKKHQMFLLSILAILLILLSIYLDIESKKIEGNRITRSDNGEGRKEISLELKMDEETWIPFSFTLEEKEYTKQELEKLYEKVIKFLPEIIKKENENLEAVTSNLELVTVLEEYPFTITWCSSAPQIIDEDGFLHFENIPFLISK